MGRFIHFLACCGWQAVWWLAWFLLFGVALSLCGMPAWPAIPAGLLAGFVHVLLFPRKKAAPEKHSPASGGADGKTAGEQAGSDAVGAALRRLSGAPPRRRRAGTSLWCISIGRDAEAVPFPAGETRAGGAVLRHAPLPFAWRRRDEQEWREFLRKIPFINQDRRAPGCVLLHLSVQWVAEQEEETLLKKARLLRARLNALEDAAKHSPAVLILVDGIDRLYGWPSLAALLPEDRLRRPLGASRGGGGRQDIDSLLDAVAAEASNLVFSSPAPSPARLQAFPEFLHVANRLRLFGKQLSGGDAPGGRLPQGIFFGSFIPGLAPLPPFAADPSFIPVEETSLRRPSLFFDSLFGTVLPEALRRRTDAPRAGRPRGILLHCAVLGMLLAALCAGWLMTRSFLRTRNILLSASGAAAHPATPAQLDGYLSLAERTAARSAASALPRFGMTEDRALAEELKRRFSESYFDLKTIPGIERLQEAALEAARSGDPRQMGNALVMLALTRDGIANAEGTPALAEESRALLCGSAVALGLTSESEMRQLRAFLQWAGSSEWMPEVREGLERFERHIAESDPLGGWLPAWVDSIPRAPAAPAGLPPAWTRQGYAAAKALAEAVVPAGGGTAGRESWSESVLGEYRKNALAAWRGAAAALRDSVPDGAPDADISSRLRLAAEGKDPASSFAALACEHLLPMHEGAGDAEDMPEIVWLRLRLQLERGASREEKRERADARPGLLRSISPSIADAVRDFLPAFAAGGKESVRAGEPVSAAAVSPGAVEEGIRLLLSLRRALAASAAAGGTPGALAPHFIEWESRAALRIDANDPVSEASRLAGELAAFLDRHAGEGVWPDLSPLAADRSLRRLLSRQAALQLDAAWLRSVYTPCRFTPGGADPQRARLAGAGGLLEQFLTGEANGFWAWRNNEVQNARWNGVSFTFSREFLDFCNAALEDSRLPAPGEIPLTLSLSSVDVDGGKVLERPTSVEFRLGSEAAGKSVVYRNYPVSDRWVWTPDVGEAAIRVVFPSRTAVIHFSGAEELRTFFTLFGEGARVLGPEAFGDSAETLRRLGVASLTVNAALSPLPDLLRQLSRPKQAVLPKSIIAQ